MKTLFRYIKPQGGWVGFCFMIKFSGTIIELLLPWMLSTILDQFVPAKDMARIATWGGLMTLASGAALTLNVAANRLSTRISRDITRALRHDLFAKVMNLSRTQEDAFTISSLISRLSSDTYNVHQFVDRMQRLGVRAPILLLGGMVVTFSMEPVLTLVLVGILPLLGLTVFWVSGRGTALYERTQQAMDVLVRRAQESMAGIRVIQALRKEDYEQRHFGAANEEVARRERTASLLMNLTNPAMNLFLNIGLTLVIVVGAYRVHAGATQSGVIIAFLSYFTIILTAMMMVSRLFLIYSRGAASMGRIEEVLLSPSEQPTQALPEREDAAHIRFEGVRFSYGKAKDNLSGISFSLDHGQTLGIIGPTGSGKSTLLSLLMRFYDTDEGQIFIDGRDVRSIPPEVLHQMFGVVFQNDFLYAGDMWENIDFARDLPREQIESAARTAQAEFLWERQQGSDTALSSKGANLSGGQKQRLLIARARAGGPEILILDDSSSALDYSTDAKLRRALAQEFAHATKIIVAQRVSSIKGADQILVLDEGRAVGLGTHEQLVANCDNYREIAQIQMGEAE